MSCGSGEATEAQLIVDGGTAQGRDGNTYSVHHSNAKIEKYQISSMTISEFTSGYYMVKYHNDGTNLYTYILGYSSSSTALPIVYKRTWNSGSSSWGDFTAPSSETHDVGSTAFNFQIGRKDALWYTGASKPTSSNWYSFISSHDATYDPTAATVYQSKSLGLIQPSSDVTMICPSFCSNHDGTNCLEQSNNCPKAAFSGMTLSSSSSTCTGSSCTYYQYSSDTAYKYKFQASDAQLYTYTDNSGSASGSATLLDGRTGVSYSTSSADEWPQTTFATMYPGSATTDFDTPAEVAAYHKTSGNVYYRVGVGRKGGYGGWTFYAQTSGDSTRVACR